ncbi:MAG: DUF2080 family transposase-associated protein [Candidatus Pacearchaeota archaeon]|nr:DUF2080 family transposase-associated protein [Candidatus Pacearchaeota archaeon]
MNKSSKDKIKKIVDDIEKLSDKIDDLKSIGEIKKITKSGNSSHIILNKEFIDREALIIILPKIK